MTHDATTAPASPGLPGDDDAMIEVGPVAETLSCSTRHVWRMVDGGLMPAPLPLGRLRRWRVGTLRQWLRDGCKAVRKAGKGT